MITSILFINNYVSCSGLYAIPVIPFNSDAIVFIISTLLLNYIPAYFSLFGLLTWSFFKASIPTDGYCAPPSVIKINTIVAFLIYLDAKEAAELNGGSNIVPPPLHGREVTTWEGLTFYCTMVELSSNFITDTFFAFVFASICLIFKITSLKLAISFFHLSPDIDPDSSRAKI